MRGGFRLHYHGVELQGSVPFQSPRGEGVVQTVTPSGNLLPKAEFQSSRGEGVVQTMKDSALIRRKKMFQSPRGEGVVQTANPRACMVMRQTGI